jgi:hypothetical protein
MFCQNVSNEEYQIFNHSVNQRQYELFEKQYKEFMTEFLAFAHSWPNESAIAEMPHIFENFKLWYQPISGKIWQWVRTLPGYDPTILYSITMNETFLKEI